jgi:GH24 family phage-related lysozyme (muramidase)
LVQIIVFAKNQIRAYNSNETGAIGRKGGFGLLAAGVIAASVPVVSQFEGRSLTAYRDIVGVVTICDGSTLDVQIGDIATDAQCDALLMRDIQSHAARISACINDDVEERMPLMMRVSVLSLGFNVGTGATCGSTLVRKLNAGDFYGACEQLPRWNKAGGKVIRGLTNRRGIERKMCIGALDEQAAQEERQTKARGWLKAWFS